MGQCACAIYTFSLYADMQALKSEEKYNCFGVGFALFTDKAGDGMLSLTRGDLNLAYHLQMGANSILSLGAAGRICSAQPEL